jgi:hypothetical protein
MVRPKVAVGFAVRGIGRWRRIRERAHNEGVLGQHCPDVISSGRRNGIPRPGEHIGQAMATQIVNLETNAGGCAPAAVSLVIRQDKVAYG